MEHKALSHSKSSRPHVKFLNVHQHCNDSFQFQTHSCQCSQPAVANNPGPFWPTHRSLRTSFSVILTASSSYLVLLKAYFPNFSAEIPPKAEESK